MTFYQAEQLDIAVIGAGHAGCEAALACARLGLDTLLFTMNADSVAKGVTTTFVVMPIALSKWDHDYLAENGIVVSIGHSAATYEQARMAYANGATSMTHVYNGMNGLHHREPSLVGAAMRLKDVYGEITLRKIHRSRIAEIAEKM